MADRKLESTPHEPIAPKIDREMLKRWKAGMEEHNQIVLEEKRNQTPAERMKGMMAFPRSHAYIGIEREKPGRRTHRVPYSEVQERLRERHPERICRD
jgi:hypothetical protein